jgi:hypothetical protein
MLCLVLFNILLFTNAFQRLQPLKLKIPLLFSSPTPSSLNTNNATTKTNNGFSSFDTGDVMARMLKEAKQLRNEAETLNQANKINAVTSTSILRSNDVSGFIRDDVVINKTTNTAEAVALFKEASEAKQAKLESDLLIVTPRSSKNEDSSSTTSDTKGLWSFFNTNSTSVNLDMVSKLTNQSLWTTSILDESESESAESESRIYNLSLIPTMEEVLEGAPFFVKLGIKAAAKIIVWSDEDVNEYGDDKSEDESKIYLIALALEMREQLVDDETSSANNFQTYSKEFYENVVKRYEELLVIALIKNETTVTPVPSSSPPQKNLSAMNDLESWLVSTSAFQEACQNAVNTSSIPTSEIQTEVDKFVTGFREYLVVRNITTTDEAVLRVSLSGYLVEEWTKDTFNSFGKDLVGKANRTLP